MPFLIATLEDLRSELHNRGYDKREIEKTLMLFKPYHI
jgi:hypothetical protein